MSGPPRWRLFAGKGGVGKTTCAAAYALEAAERGARVLLASTDPAHSLGDALERPVGPQPVAIPTRRGALFACELDVPAALARWLEQRRGALVSVAARGTLLREGEAERFLRLSLPGADELLGLLEVERLAHEGSQQVVVVDTAPTGHTLRLLDAPATLARLAEVLDALLAKHRWLGARFGHGHRRDAADDLVDELAERGAALGALLRDPQRCQVAWVLAPQALAVEETLDGVRALTALGVPVPDLIVNQLTPGDAREGCPACAARGRLERESLQPLRGLLGGRRLRVVPRLAREPRGLAALRGVARQLRPVVPAAGLGPPAEVSDPPTRSGRSAPPAWAAGLAGGGRRLLLFGGKGGVGKTTCAVTAALAAADLGREVLLLSVDPAHSTADALGLTSRPDDGVARPVPGSGGRLRLRELDGPAVFARARARWQGALDELFQVLTGAGIEATLDQRAARELLDLAPPGLNELLGALEVVDELLGPGSPADGLLVVDTPPTGHALRLLETPALALEWTRTCLGLLRDHGVLGTLARDLTDTARRLRQLQALLTDPLQTGFVVVTRAGALPVRETGRLLGQLERLAVPVAAVVINAAQEDRAGCGRCRAAARADGEAADELRAHPGAWRGSRPGWTMIRAPLALRAPVGASALRAWGLTWQLAEADGVANGTGGPRRARSTSTASSRPTARRRGEAGRRGSRGSAGRGRSR